MNNCEVCENIYTDNNDSYIDIDTYEWDYYNDGYVYITIPLKFCYECGKDLRKND